MWLCCHKHVLNLQKASAQHACMCQCMHAGLVRVRDSLHAIQMRCCTRCKCSSGNVNKLGTLLQCCLADSLQAVRVGSVPEHPIASWASHDHTSAMQSCGNKPAMACCRALRED